jgi:PAS domain S-box-containing protein
MVNDPQKTGTRLAKRGHSRPTIGLLIGRLGEVGYAAEVWPGVADVAEERNVNLVCFVGGALQAVHEFDSQRNVAYNLAGPDNMDGLVIMSGSLGQFIGPEQFRNFLERYQPLPMVSIAMALEGMPGILVDNKTGMREAITHLIEVHKLSRIAFIRGPETNPEAEERYHTYQEVLTEHGLPIDPDLIVGGNFLARAGAEAARLLMDERKVDFEAVASANDEMALSAMAVLQERGLRVPGQVSVVGFDNMEESKFSLPPLTTIRQPLYEQGRLATETLLSILAGEKVPGQISLPTSLVIRQSCGCFLRSEVRETETGKLSGGSSKGSFDSQREFILSEMTRVANISARHLAPGWTGRLLDAFYNSVKDGIFEPFLAELDETLRHAGQVNSDLLQWLKVLDVLRYRAFPLLSIDIPPDKIQDLWRQAGSLISEIAQWAQANRRLQADRRAFEFTVRVSEPLMSSFDVASLTDVIAQQLPQMGITSCYLALYEKPIRGKQAVPSKWSRLILAYDQDGRVELEPGGRRFLSHNLVPEDILPSGRRHALILEPLHFRDEVQLGFILFEPLSMPAGVLREALSRQISIALKGALLLQERSQAQSALQASEEKYRSLLQFNNEILKNAPIGIIRLDTELKIQYENPELESIIGLPSDETRSRAMGTDIRQIPGIQNAGLVPDLDELQKGQSIQKEAPFSSIYGKKTIVKINGCPIREKGRYVGSVILVEDITERKRAEEALAASEGRYRILAEASHDMIFIVAGEGYLEYVNGLAARQLGIRPEAIIGKKIEEMFPEAEAHRNMGNISQVLATKMPMYVENPVSFPHEDLWLGTWLIPLQDSRGQVTSVMGVSRDITGRKQAEKELKEYSEKLEEKVGERTAELQQALQKAQMADRLKSEFLANVNHELRTPLTNLILYYQMLSAHPQDKTKERLDVIGRELQRLRNLIENLLNLSHLEAEQLNFRLKPHDLNLIIQNLVNDRLAMAEERGLAIKMELSPSLPSVLMYDALIIQAVSNLLTNAMNYTPAGGKVYVRTEESVRAGRPGVIFCVQDTGPGINTKDLPHIFERFYRGSAGHETGAPGTGLGLAIVKEVVERHHGTIEVENSMADHGAAFTIWLPLDQRQTGISGTKG